MANNISIKERITSGFGKLPSIKKVGQTKFISDEEFNQLPGQSNTINTSQETTQAVETGDINFFKRLKLGFGGKEAKAERLKIEKEAGLRGKLDIGDIADIVPGAIPFVSSVIGGLVAAPTGVGVVPGAAVGAGIGETIKRGIGRFLGVRKDVPVTTEATGVGKEVVLTYLGGKVLSGLGKFAVNRFPKLLGIFSGEGDDAIRAALKNPKAADAGIKGGDEALRKVVQEGAENSIRVRDAFIRGHGNAFKLLTQKVPEKVSNRKEILNGFETILKNNNVKVSKEGLDFSISKIKANPGEIGKINNAWEAIQNWDDFSLKGVNELKQLIGTLTKFADEAGIPSKSPTLGKTYNFLNQTIKDKLPTPLKSTYELMNKKFSTNIELYNDAADAFNKGDPFTKLANALGKNKDSLRQTLDFFEKKTGQKVIPVIGGREIGLEKTAAFGFLNPRSWVDFFISPQTQGRIITGAGRLGKFVPKQKQVVTGAAQLLTEPFKGE